MGSRPLALVSTPLRADKVQKKKKKREEEIKIKGKGKNKELIPAPYGRASF